MIEDTDETLENSFTVLKEWYRHTKKETDAAADRIHRWIVSVQQHGEKADNDQATGRESSRAG